MDANYIYRQQAGQTTGGTPWPTPSNWNFPTINPWWQQPVITTPIPVQPMLSQQPAQPQQQQPVQQPQQVQQPQATPQPAPQSNTQHRISSARVVVSQDEIKPNEIPMDDSITIFLQDDLNRIYGKRWTNNGTVENLEYARVNNESQQTAVPAPSSNEALEEFRSEVNSKFDQVFEMLKKWLE